MLPNDRRKFLIVFLLASFTLTSVIFNISSKHVFQILGVLFLLALSSLIFIVSKWSVREIVQNVKVRFALLAAFLSIMVVLGNALGYYVVFNAHDLPNHLGIATVVFIVIVSMTIALIEFLKRKLSKKGHSQPF